MTTKGASLVMPQAKRCWRKTRSPCTEEIAVFQAFSRIIREAGRKFVVMDAAPTGHTACCCWMQLAPITAEAEPGRWVTEGRAFHHTDDAVAGPTPNQGMCW